MNITLKIQEGFIFCVATALFVFGVVVLWTAHQPTRVLDGVDPILPLSSRDVFYLTGVFELAVSAYLLVVSPRRVATKLVITAWLSANYFVYAIGLRLMNGANLFSCLGNVNNWLTVSPKNLDFTLYIFFGGLLSGACLLLAFGWLARSKPASPKPTTSSVLQNG